MSRPLRIQYPGAWYHVMNRGRRREVIFPAKEIIMNPIDIIISGEYPKIRISGKISPPIQGVKIWILREHTAKLPGHYHIGAKPAFTDQNGEWQQFTNLWRGGSFRIYAIMASGNAERLLEYYRESFDHARKIYRETVDENAASFPDWPFLKSLPTGCIAKDQSIVLENNAA